MADVIRLNDLEETQRRLEHKMQMEIQKMVVSELKLQGGIDGLKSDLQVHITGWNEKFNHMSDLLASIQLQLFNINKGKDNFQVAEPCSISKKPYTIADEYDSFTEETTEIREHKVFQEMLESEMKVACVTELVETKLESEVEENEYDGELVEGEQNWIGQDLGKPVVVIDFSRGKGVVIYEQKVFDKIPMREMEFQSRKRADITAPRPSPKPPPMLDIHLGTQPILKRPDDSARITTSKLVQLVKIEKWECLDDKASSEFLLACQSKEGYLLMEAMTNNGGGGSKKETTPRLRAAAEEVVHNIGLGYDLMLDLRLKYCKKQQSTKEGSRLIVMDDDQVRNIAVSSGILVQNVPKSINCYKGERMRFISDVLAFQQILEKFNQELSLLGKIPTGHFNTAFEFTGCWQKDATLTKSLAFEGVFITLYNIALEKSQVMLRDHVKQAVSLSWDPAALARFIEKYGTHIIVGVKMGGKDVIYVTQQYSSPLQPIEVQKRLKDVADKRLTTDTSGQSSSRHPEKAYGREMRAANERGFALLDPSTPSFHSIQEEVTFFCRRRGGSNNRDMPHSKWC